MSIVSNTLECESCHKLLCNCADHVVYKGHDFCSPECVLDFIDKDILRGDEVISEDEYEFREKCRLAQW